MSYFNSTKETVYSKVEVEGEQNPPTYVHVNNDTSSTTHIPMVSETRNSRFMEPNHFISDQEYNNYLYGQDKGPKRKRNYCKLLVNISLIVGIVFLLLSIVFKIQSRSYISEAIANGCPANCVTTCYRKSPLYQDSYTCDSDTKQNCDEQCLSVGMDQANTYTILFYVFVATGAFLMAIQIATSCLGYCCFDYFKYKKQQNQVADSTNNAPKF